jgi:hypothetical protein
VSFSPTFSEPYNNRPAPMPATLHATGHLTFEFTAGGVGTTTPRRREDVVLDGARRATKRSDYLVRVETLTDGTHMVGVVGTTVTNGGIGDLDSCVLDVAQAIVDDFESRAV